jgi:hypothetical protein
MYGSQKIPKVALFPLPLWANVSHSTPSPHYRLYRMVLLDRLHCHFIQRQFLEKDSEYTFQVVIVVPILTLYAFPELKKSLF